MTPVERKASEPVVFVGTLHCGEAEFEESAAMIAKQCGVHVIHRVIGDLAEREAHNELWRAWNASRSQCDLFVKIDADTILRDETVLAQIHARFAEDYSVTGMQIPLHDYFGDVPIVGLTAISPAVHFVMSNDDLYCDRNCEVGHAKILRGEDVASLSPAGYHCLYPHPRQAFHFGYRRFLKGQFDILNASGKAWRRLGGEGRLWALIGACAANRKKISDASYSNPAFESLFASCLEADDWPTQIEEFLPILSRQRQPEGSRLGNAWRGLKRLRYGLRR